MNHLETARLLFKAGRHSEAVALIDRAAAADDPEANFAIANWRLFGQYGPRDYEAAHDHLRRAARKGHLPSIQVRAFFLANGTGGPADPEKALKVLRKIASRDPYAAKQVRMLQQMSRVRVGKLPRERLSESPLIELVRGLFTAEECAYVMRQAEPSLGPSYVFDPLTGDRKLHPVRTSYGTNFGPMQEDLVINAFNRRIAAASGTDSACGEPLYVLRYTPGQEFKPHLDALEGVANQRAWTALTYLNDGYEGGETCFHHLGIIVRGGAGDTLIFRNVSEDGQTDPRSEHAGLPVTQGVKWMASRWIRERPFDAFQME